MSKPESKSEIEMTARQELEEIAEVLREADEAEKAAKSLKDEVKPAFLDLISEVVRDEVLLSREIVTVEMKDLGDDVFDSESWRKYNYPLHRIVAIQPESDEEDGPATRFVITLEENDEFKKFEFTTGGFKYGRTVRMDGKGFEADKFVESIDAFEVGHEIRDAMREIVKKEVVTTYSVNEVAMQNLMAEHPETVTIFQAFINPGTPKVALLPIKKAKELEE